MTNNFNSEKLFDNLLNNFSDANIHNMVNFNILTIIIFVLISLLFSFKIIDLGRKGQLPSGGEVIEKSNTFVLNSIILILTVLELILLFI